MEKPQFSLNIGLLKTWGRGLGFSNCHSPMAKFSHITFCQGKENGLSMQPKQFWVTFERIAVRQQCFSASNLFPPLSVCQISRYFLKIDEEIISSVLGLWMAKYNVQVNRAFDILCDNYRNKIVQYLSIYVRKKNMICSLILTRTDCLRTTKLIF